MPLLAHSDSQCDVCLDSYTFDSVEQSPHAIPCGHIFCKECLVRIGPPSACPLCRKAYDPSRIKKMHIDKPPEEQHNRARELLEKLVMRFQVDETTFADLGNLVEEVDKWLEGEPGNSHMPLRSMRAAVRSHQRTKDELSKEREEHELLTKHYNMRERMFQHERDKFKQTEDSLQTTLKESQMKLSSVLSDFTRIQGQMSRLAYTPNPLPAPPEPVPLFKLPEFARGSLMDDAFTRSYPTPSPPDGSEPSQSRPGTSHERSGADAMQELERAASRAAGANIYRPGPSFETMHNAVRFGHHDNVMTSSTSSTSPSAARHRSTQSEDIPPEPRTSRSFEAATTFVGGYEEGLRDAAYYAAASPRHLPSGAAPAVNTSYPYPYPFTAPPYDRREETRYDNPSRNHHHHHHTNRPPTALQVAAGPRRSSDVPSQQEGHYPPHDELREYLQRRAPPQNISRPEETDVQPHYVILQVPPSDSSLMPPPAEPSFNPNRLSTGSAGSGAPSSHGSSQGLLRAPPATRLSDSHSVHSRASRDSRISVMSGSSWGTVLSHSSSVGSMNLLNFQRGDGIRPTSLNSSTGSGSLGSAPSSQRSSMNGASVDAAAANPFMWGAWGSTYSSGGATSGSNGSTSGGRITDGSVTDEPEPLSPTNTGPRAGIYDVPISYGIETASSSGSSTARPPSHQRSASHSVLEDSMSRPSSSFTAPVVPSPSPTPGEIVQRSHRVHRRRAIRQQQNPDNNGQAPMLPPLPEGISRVMSFSDFLNQSSYVDAPTRAESRIYRDSATRDHHGSGRSRSTTLDSAPNSLGLDLGPSFDVDLGISQPTPVVPVPAEGFLRSFNGSAPYSARR